MKIKRAVEARRYSLFLPVLSGSNPTPPPLSFQPHENNRVPCKNGQNGHFSKGLARQALLPILQNRRRTLGPDSGARTIPALKNGASLPSQDPIPRANSPIDPRPVFP